MDSPFPLDSDRSSELLAALDTLRDNMNMGDMEHDLVLEVLDTPDRLATRCRANDSSRTSGMVIDLDGEFVDSSSDWKAVPAARIDSRYQRSSNVCEVLSHNTAQDNNNCIRMKGSLAKTLNNKQFLPNNGKVLNSEQEESLISAGLCQQISSPISHPAPVMDLRRKKGEEVLSQRKSVMTGGYTGLLEELSQQNSSLGKMEHGSSFSSEVVADIGNEERDQGKGKQIDIGNDLQDTSEEGLSRQLLLNRPQRNMTQKRLVRNGFISPHNIAKSNISSKVDGLNITKSCVGETCSLHRNVSGQDYKKGNYMQISSDGPTKVVTRRPGHRKLVRNGRISPNNIGHCKNVTEGDIIGDTVSNDFSDGNSSVQVHIINSDSKNGWSDRRIGKEKLYANIAQNVKQTKAEPQLDRECLKAWREDTSVTSASDTLGSAKIGPMASRDHKGKASANLFIRSANVSKRGETVSQLFDQTHENEIALGERDHVNLLHDSPEIIVSPLGLNSSTFCASVTSVSNSECGRQHRCQKQKAKRKCNTARPHSGECSSLPSEDPENSYIQSSTRASNPKSIRCHETKWNGELLGPGFEVDQINFPSNFQHSNGYDGSNARLSQVESDEILARQLQEQFYHELPGSEDTEEIDASIAWSLQRQEDSRLVASTRHNQSHPRDASMAHLFVHGPRPSFQTYSQQLANHARSSASSRMAQFRRNFNSPEIDLEMSIVAELRRNFNSGEMDLDTRLKLLEALEAAFESSEDMEMLDDTLLVQRDITEDDYEMLLALDDNNYQHSGASESQIDSLPESVIQSNSNEEACAICLEPPAVGDVIRHLPCLHKFHKECIDTWLRRRTSCPVCKSGIS